MEDDWDLHAVVRGCATTTSTSNSASTSYSADTINNPFLFSFQPRQQDHDDNSFCFQDPFESRFDNNNNNSAFQAMHDLYDKPLFPESTPSSPLLLPPPFSRQSLPISPLSVLGGLQDLPPQRILKEQQPQQQHQLDTRILTQQKRSMFAKGSTTSTTYGSRGTSHVQTPRTKIRKNQLKKVCHVPAEALSSDVWSWRKYGQKPIKSSPHPRGYYKCSTSKGCLARKQVERSRSDPNMFIVTYTSEHNHPIPALRNSLAGNTRQKTANAEISTASDSHKPTSSSPAGDSPAPEKQEISRDEKEHGFDDDDDEFDVSNTALCNMEPDNDFFEGLEELAGPIIMADSKF